jgi:16S rRNA (adenine1518-N6/adenine1519-N6)-dimethyltransferase
MSARKQFGQHWLRSEVALRKIVAAAELTSRDRVLEIGPGQGALTSSLLARVEALVAVEIDRDLHRALGLSFEGAAKLKLIEGDVLSLNLDAMLAGTPFAEPNKVVANIPYNITGPILQLLLGTIAKPSLRPYERIVLLVQKEVADRICARPGNRTFGGLTVRVQYLAEARTVCTVPARAFSPPPKVDSAVIVLTPRPIALPADNPKQLETLVKLGFATKRKMLRNNLKSVVERDALTAILETLGSTGDARGEDLSLEQWVAMSNALGTIEFATEVVSDRDALDPNDSDPTAPDPEAESELEESR